MNRREAVDLLDSLTNEDQEEAHAAADDTLCKFLISAGFIDVAEAFERADERVGFWYA